MRKKMLILSIVIMVGINTEAQTSPSASSTGHLNIGFSYLFGYPDYSPQKANGFGIFVDYDFMRHYGVTFDYHRADVSQHPDTETSYEFGGRYHRSYGLVSPYIRAAVGRAAYKFGPQDHSSPSEGFTAAQGGNTTDYTLFAFAAGADIKVSSHFSVRAETDSQHWLSGQNLENGLAPFLYTVGIGYHLGGGGGQSYPPQMGCMATPTSIFPGDPIKIVSSTINVGSAEGLTYAWSTSGGKIESKVVSSEVEIGTSGLAPGQYLVEGRLVKQKGGRVLASCEALFTVREFEPPTVTCSANPPSGMPGMEISISSTGRSPQNRPLTYSYATTGGTVQTTGSTAVLATDGLSAGPITITCNVTDDLGHNSSSTVTVPLTAVPTPVPAVPQSLCSVSFKRDHLRPVRVDNEAKACLDDIVMKLKASVDSHLIVIGSYDLSETNYSAAERAVNVKKYLVDEKHVDPSSIELRISNNRGRTLKNILVPVGAFFNDPSTYPFNEKSVVK